METDISYLRRAVDEIKEDLSELTSDFRELTGMLKAGGQSQNSVLTWAKTVIIALVSAMAALAGVKISQGGN